MRRGERCCAALHIDWACVAVQRQVGRTEQHAAAFGHGQQHVHVNQKGLGLPETAVTSHVFGQGEISVDRTSFVVNLNLAR